MMARAWEHNMVPFNNREDIRCWIDARARPARRFYRRCVQQGDPIRTPRLRSRGAAAQERAEKRSAAAPHQRADRRRLNADDARGCASLRESVIAVYSVEQNMAAPSDTAFHAKFSNQDSAPV